MKYFSSLSLDCPYCNTKCEFQKTPYVRSTYCREDKKWQLVYSCHNCKGAIITNWDLPSTMDPDDAGNTDIPMVYCPSVGDWKPKIELSCITKCKVKADFKEAIKCYINGLYNSCMIMARRAIEQDLIEQDLEDKEEEKMEDQKKDKNRLINLIKSKGLSPNLKELLDKVRIFGNSGAHPDFVLVDKKGKK